MRSLNAQEVLQATDLNGLIEKSLDLLADASKTIRLPVNAQGVISPEHIAYLTLNLRMLEYRMMLNVFKLQETIAWTVSEPRPDVVDLAAMAAWTDKLCKYLHPRITNFTLNLLKQVQEENMPVSNLVLPTGLENPAIFKPRT